MCSTVELHGNLSQNARTRNMDAFHSGKATTLVATDIAARGIHVDDVALVVHADPPVEHKAYLHRSGRTARAGAAGTVITLMTDEQVRDVRDLTRAAGIKPTTTRINGAAHPMLVQLAPGDRVTVPGGLVVEAPAPAQGGRRPNGGGDGSGGRTGGGRNRSRRGRGGQDSRGTGGASAQSKGSAGSSSSGSSGGKPGAKAGGSGNGGSRRRTGPTSGGQSRPGSSKHSAASFSSGRR